MPRLSLGSKHGANSSRTVDYRKIEPHNLLISVNDPTVKAGEVYYKISIMDPLRPRVAIHSVSRTYTDLKAVLKKLAGIDKGANLPHIPKTKLFGNLEESFIEQRRVSIELNLNAVCRNRLLCYDVDFLGFVGYQEAARDRMARCALLMELADTPTLHGFISILKMTETVQSEIEDHIIAARCWLRSKDSYVFIRALHDLTHPNWYTSKVNILVEDVIRKPYILTVQNIKENVSYFGTSAETGLSSSERVKRVKQLMCDNDRVDGVFAPLTELELYEGRLYAIRPYYSMGSLYDYVYKVSDPLSSGSVKYKNETNELPLSSLQKICQSVFHIVKSCHDFGIPTTNLTMGNLLVEVYPKTGHLRCLLGGFEDVLAGNGWLPYKPPNSYDGGKIHHSPTESHVNENEVQSAVSSSSTRTNIDILLFGTIIYQCTYGCALTAEGIESLLQVQGDPFVSKAAELSDNIIITQTSHVLSNIQCVNDESSTNHVVNGLKQSGLKGIKYLLETPFEVLNLLHYIFHPYIPVDELVLAHHSFLRADVITSAAEHGKYYSPDTKVALQLKKKELEIFVEMTRLWERESDQKRLRREKADRVWNEMRAGGQSLPLVELSVDPKLTVSECRKRRESKRREKVQ